MLENEKDLFGVFDDLGIKFTLYRHPPFFTVAESRAQRQDWPGGHCKCLFLKDKKGNMVLAVVHEDLKIDLKALAKTLGFGRFSFCSEERLMRVLKITPGAVNPFSVMNAGDLEEGETFQMVIDAGLKAFERVHFHPLHNEATVGISFPDLVRFIEGAGYAPKIIDLG